MMERLRTDRFVTNKREMQNNLPELGIILWGKYAVWDAAHQSGSNRARAQRLLKSLIFTTKTVKRETE